MPSTEMSTWKSSMPMRRVCSSRTLSYLPPSGEKVQVTSSLPVSPTRSLNKCPISSRTPWTDNEPDTLARVHLVSLPTLFTADMLQEPTFGLMSTLPTWETCTVSSTPELSEETSATVNQDTTLVFPANTLSSLRHLRLVESSSSKAGQKRLNRPHTPRRKSKSTTMEVITLDQTLEVWQIEVRVLGGNLNKPRRRTLSRDSSWRWLESKRHLERLGERSRVLLTLRKGRRCPSSNMYHNPWKEECSEQYRDRNKTMHQT